MINDEFERSENKDQKYFLLKHHYWMDFRKFNMSQPTFINVVREPTSWFTSRYYFKRYGWKNNNNARVELTPNERDRSINDCIMSHYDECTSFSHQPYLSYFCGCDDICKNLHSLNPIRRERALELTRVNILREFHIIGILEQFDETLELFERILPEYFNGALRIWKSKKLQDKRDSTRTRNRTEMSEEARHSITSGTLKHEMDIYLMIKALFNQRVKSVLKTNEDNV